ncbi:MAG: restriction endonuclease [Terriglobia bacterium]
MASDSDKWKHFERLVAAIHQAADKGAQVQWNEMINGRQFDVTIRFRRGLYDYLTVVECKNYEKPVPVEKVEAFITKSSDAHADHAVMASTSGFQEGAQQVARKHNMTLIHVTPSDEIDLSAFGAHWAGITDALHVQSVELEYTDGERKRLSEEANVMTYYVNQVLIQCGPERGTLSDLIFHHLPRFLGGEADTQEQHIIECPSGTRVIGPNDGEIPLKPLACVHIRVGVTKAKVITGPVIFDPYLLVPDVKVTDVATGEEKKFSQHGLALGVDTVFAEGKFYEQPQLATCYYCERIDGNLATIYLVESFQHGRLIQAKMTVETKYANLYVPVSDKAAIQRLQRRLDHLKATEAKG